jgi:ribosome modulation factor
MTKVDLDDAAWSAGYAAGLVGKSKPCPYPAGSSQSLSWSSGLIEGKAKRDQGFRRPHLAKPKP